MKKRIITIIFLIWMSNLCLLSAEENTFNIRVLNTSLVEKFLPQNTQYTFKSLTTEYPLELIVDAPEGTSLKVNGQKESINEKISIPIKEISDNNKISVEVKLKGQSDYIKYTFKTMPNDIPKYQTIGQSPYEGDYYLDTYSNPCYILKLNNKGSIIYYNRDTSKMADFKKQVTVDGKIRYTYHIQEKVPTLETGYMAGSIVILDEKYQEIKRVKLEKSDRVEEGFPTENHDFILLSDDHYILSAYVNKIVHNVPLELWPSPYGARVIASVIQEVKDGKVVWEWDSTDYPEFYAASKTSNDYTNKTLKWADYIHFNSMQIDPKDGNLICSFRHIDSVIKINRKTGEIMWILGGDLDQFGLNEYQKFSHQHYARMTPDFTITIFDNGNSRGLSRVLEIKINEETKELYEFKEYIKDDQFSSWAGSVDKIKDNVFLIGWGGRRPQDPSMSEIDFNTQQVLFELYLPGDSATYRAVKIK